MRKTLFVVLALALLFVLASSSAGAQQAPANIEQRLWDKVTRDGTANFFVKMAAEADLSAAYGMTDWSARGKFVYEALQKVAQESQSPVIAYAKKHGLEYKSFFTTNAVYIRGGNLQAMTDLAKIKGVKFLREERIYMLPDPVLGAAAGLNGIPGPAPMASVPNTVEWGIQDTNADDVWLMYGVRGAGTKVANIDTGVQWNHPALINKFACPGDPTNPACWRDPSNICGAGGTCDNNGHGTHTMGTMVGDDGGANQIGMAPDATWIACKGCESSSCSESALNSCADWVVAPDGNPDNRPDVVNNSWGGGGGDNWYLPKVNAWRAAGIFPAFSAGNNYSCSSLGSPGDYQESFGSAAHNVSRAIASFSSKGPSAFGHDPYTKPNISAPGENVRSSVPTNSYANYSGTSMASPHTSGAVALLWSGCPDYRGQIDLTFELLQNHTDAAPAGSCGAPPDGEGNYTFGYGYLNVLSAIQTCISGTELGTLEGHVYDELGNPIPDVSVNAQPAADGHAIQALTDPNGFYTMQLLAGTYNVTASKYGYETVTHNGIVVVANQTTVDDFTLASVPVWMPGTPTTFQFYRNDAVFNPHDGLIYFLGGRTSGTTHDKSIWTYNATTGVSTDTGKDLLYNAANYTIALIEDDGTGRGVAMYIIGGYDVIAAANIDKVQRFYPQSGTVEVVATDPYPDRVAGQIVGAPGVAVVNDKVYVFGGWESAASPYFSDKTWVFDPQGAAGSRWTNLACTLSPARSYINTAVAYGKVYALGGVSQYVGGDLAPTATAQVFNPANPGGCWQNLANMPAATAEGRGFGFDADTEGTGKLYVVGGGDWPSQSADVFVYDIAGNTWSTDFPVLAQARRDFAGAYVSSCTADPTDPFPSMYVFGGQIGSDDPPYGDPEFYPLPCAAGPTVHVHEIDMRARQQGNRFNIRATVYIMDNDGNWVEGAVVDIDVTLPNSQVRAFSRTTDVAGRAVFSGRSPLPGTYTVCVTDVTKAGFTYDPSQNLETCDSITVP